MCMSIWYFCSCIFSVWIAKYSDSTNQKLEWRKLLLFIYFCCCCSLLFDVSHQCSLHISRFYINFAFYGTTSNKEKQWGRNISFFRFISLEYFLHWSRVLFVCLFCFFIDLSFIECFVVIVYSSYPSFIPFNLRKNCNAEESLLLYNF